MDPLVTACRNHLGAVGREADLPHLCLRLAERIEPLAIGDPPEFDGLVATGGGQDATVGMPGEVEDGCVVDSDLPQQRGVGRIPKSDRAIVSSGREQAAVRRELSVVEQIAVAGKRQQHIARRRVSQFCLTAHAGRAASQHESLPITREMHHSHLAGQVVKRPHRGRIGAVGQAVGPNRGDLDRPATGDAYPRVISRVGQGGDRLAAGEARQLGHHEAHREGMVVNRARGTGGNPVAQGLHVGLGRLRMLTRWHVVVAGALDPLQQHGGRRVAGHDRVALTVATRPQAGERVHREAAFRIAAAVAAKAGAPQQGHHCLLVGRAGFGSRTPVWPQSRDDR